MTVHAILIGVEVTGTRTGTSDPARNARRAIRSMRRCLEGPNQVPVGQIQELPPPSDDPLVDNNGPVTRQNVVDAFNAISPTHVGDTIVVMFAGHGRKDGNTFKGWALSGQETFSPECLRKQYDKYHEARWIVLSDCCYAAGMTEELGFVGRARRLLHIVLEKILKVHFEEGPFKRLVESTVTETGTTDRSHILPTSLIAIAAAAKNGIVYDAGELLFSTLVAGSSLGQLSYVDLKQSFDLTSMYGQAFDCKCTPDDRFSDSVMT